jgi:hypothetical protein
MALLPRASQAERSGEPLRLRSGHRGPAVQSKAAPGEKTHRRLAPRTMRR